MQIIIGKFTAKPEKREELLQLARSMFAPSRGEDGCISYEFYEDSTRENSFVFLEEWENSEAIARHFETEHFKRFMEKFPDTITGNPSIKIYDVSNIKQL